MKNVLKYNFKVPKFFIRCTLFGRISHNHTNRKPAESAKVHREEDKPPDRHYPYLTRNAKFILLFKKGEFGFFYYELENEIYRVVSSTDVAILRVNHFDISKFD